ncbi:MAG: aldehyde dehydrogenase family protein [Thermoplasmata archaeon]|nr:aldehyde dehydrogenase family protein [Thermoplasmata archaeon]
MAAATRPAYSLFIGGANVPGTKNETRTVPDPSTREPFATVAVGGADDARHALEVADKAFRESNWASDDGARRTKALFRLAGLVEADLEGFAQLETQNQGKTIRESRFDIGFVVRTLEYHAGLADKIEGETIPVPGGRFDYTSVEPLGVTVHIAPWNYPLLLAVRSIAPALAAGNAVILKPASLTPLSSLRFAQLAKSAGIPDGIFNVVVGSGSAVGEALVDDDRCRTVAFTGSGDVGRRIQEIAARRMIPTTLELGGKGPVVVLADADLDRAAKGIGWGIFGNAGQMCWAGSRLLVDESVRAPLLERLVALAQKLKVGPGSSPDAEMGPLVSPEQQESVLGFVTEAKDAGASIVTGGQRYTDGPLSQGNFLPPTIVDGVNATHRIVREEVFGPVLAVQSFRSVEEGISMANETQYGLLASVWTRDLATAHAVARRLESGMVVINDPPTTFPQTPFAGFRGSGLGSEQGRRALEFYTRRKNVMVNVGRLKGPAK